MKTVHSLIINKYSRILSIALRHYSRHSQWKEDIEMCTNAPLLQNGPASPISIGSLPSHAEIKWYFWKKRLTLQKLRTWNNHVAHDIRIIYIIR